MQRITFFDSKLLPSNSMKKSVLTANYIITKNPLPINSSLNQMNISDRIDQLNNSTNQQFKNETSRKDFSSASVGSSV